ncbi:MAG: hypothetical protein DMF83_04355 [Acidobacteria bacterium]|nr:MAG: hypothetical protein DMF83_04355 [Acidobacteriota bacterium]
MKGWLAAAGTMLLSVSTPAFAHRLDEYLQATTISLEKDRVQAQIRLTPGVAVFPIVFASIDSDADGIISEAEQHAYAERVLRDLSLTIDGDRVQLRLVSSRASNVQEMMDGRGEIQLDVDGNVPHGGHDRRLVFENHHESRIAAYLVNCLVPSDPDIRVTAQDRNYDQSFYQLDYVETGARSGPLSLGQWSGAAGWLGAAALVLFARLAATRREE